MNHKLLSSLFTILLAAAAGAAPIAGRCPESSRHVGAAQGAALLIETCDGAVTVDAIATSRTVHEAYGLTAAGRQLLYRPRVGGVPSGELLLEDLATGEVRHLTSRHVLEARLSPDDSRVAFTFASGDAFGIAIIDILDDRVEERTVRSSNVLPDVIAFTADGLAFYAVEDVVRRGVEGLDDEQVNEHSVAILHPWLADRFGRTRTVAPDELPAGFPAVDRAWRADEVAATLVEAESAVEGRVPSRPMASASAPPALRAFSLRSPDGRHVVHGTDLLAGGPLEVEEGGVRRPLATGRVLAVLDEGVVARAFDGAASSLALTLWDGSFSVAGRDAVGFNLPFASTYVTQGGGCYGSPGNCNLWTHTCSSSMGYAYDFWNSAGHIMAVAPGTAVYVKSDVTCNSCDTSGCPDYSPSCASNYGWGNAVILEHADSSYTKYTHLVTGSPRLAVGQAACQGLWIARQGHTGCASGTGCGDHLHYQRQSTAQISGPSMATDFADVSSDPLGCGRTYASGSTETSSCGAGNCTASVPAGNWKGEYFANRYLTGSPAMVRDDGSSTLSFNWGTGSPSPTCGIGSDNFSARLTRTLTLPAGTYRFTTTADDGVRLSIDGTLVIDRWIDQAPTTYTADRVLAAGSHTLKLEYYENAGGATLALSWQAISSPCTATVAATSWRGEYFGNVNLNGTPAMVRDDGAAFLSFDWGTGSPSSSCGIPADNFSARFTRTVSFASGAYRFTATADDGVRLSVDGVLVIDRWIDQAPTTYTVDRNLTAGNHVIKLEYYERAGGAVAKLSWAATTFTCDDGDACFTQFGPSQYWWRSTTCGGAPLGQGGDVTWTLANGNLQSNYARWSPSISAGTYAVAVFVPRCEATSQQARYRIVHAGATDTRTVNQNAYYDAWVSLGTFSFSGAAGEYVELSDATGESVSLQRKVAFDAVRFTRQ